MGERSPPRGSGSQAGELWGAPLVNAVRQRMREQAGYRAVAMVDDDDDG
jgi:hypothetical protein